ncbi:MAG: winged helix-turn-helix domain-containing protein [Bacteroidales bacterium]|nr:winged helix-turn-helix domain-containing protein [Bacteroidales bacterium]
MWWFDGERISFRRNSTSIILKLMMEKPDITIVELAKQVSINISAVNKQIKQLQEKGFVERSVKNGFWHLILTPSL